MRTMLSITQPAGSFTLRSFFAVASASPYCSAIVCDVPAGWTKVRAHCQRNARKGADAADLEVPAKDGRAVFDIPRDWIGVSVRKAE